MQSLSNIVTAPQRATRQAECDKHGPYESRQYTAKIWSNCPECIKAADAAAKAKAEKLEREQEQRRWEARLERSCIPVRFLDRTLKNYEAKTDGQQQALAFATAYADNFDKALETGRCALFVGLPGTGKTHLAAGIGLRYYTSIGPIRVDVAVPLNPRDGDKPWALYVSIGQAF